MDNPEGRKASYSSIPYFHMWFPSWFTNQSIFQNSDRYYIYFTFLDNVLYIHWSSDIMWLEKNVHLTSVVFSLKISSLNAVVCLFGLTTDWTKAGKMLMFDVPKILLVLLNYKKMKNVKESLNVSLTKYYFLYFSHFIPLAWISSRALNHRSKNKPSRAVPGWGCFECHCRNS